jgi:hypothetical protein
MGAVKRDSLLRHVGHPGWKMKIHWKPNLRNATTGCGVFTVFKRGWGGEVVRSAGAWGQNL